LPLRGEKTLLKKKAKNNNVRKGRERKGRAWRKLAPTGKEEEKIHVLKGEEEKCLLPPMVGGGECKKDVKGGEKKGKNKDRHSLDKELLLEVLKNFGKGGKVCSRKKGEEAAVAKKDGPNVAEEVVNGGFEKGEKRGSVQGGKGGRKGRKS